MSDSGVKDPTVPAHSRLKTVLEYIAGATVVATWLWAALLFRNKNAMRTHNISMNIIKWPQNPADQAPKTPYFSLDFRTIYECPLDTLLDQNRYATSLVIRAANKINPIPWYTPWRNHPWYYNRIKKLDAPPAQLTPFIFLDPKHQSYVMRSIINTISKQYPLGALAEALHMPVVSARFIVALTCEHERVFFTKTRTLLIREDCLKRIAQLIADGHTVDRTTVTSAGVAPTWQRIKTISELARLYNQDPNKFYACRISMPKWNP